MIAARQLETLIKIARILPEKKIREFIVSIQKKFRDRDQQCVYKVLQSLIEYLRKTTEVSRIKK